MTTRSRASSQPATTGGWAVRAGPTTYTAFAVFATEADREALLAAGGPVLSKTYAHLFAGPPAFDKVDVVESRPPSGDE